MPVSHYHVVRNMKYGGVKLWLILTSLFQIFDEVNMPATLKRGLIISLFKGKGHKASNKDHYRGLTLLPVLCKVFEMIMVSRLSGRFSFPEFPHAMQFGFLSVSLLCYTVVSCGPLV